MKRICKKIMVCLMVMGVCGCSSGSVENNAPTIKLEGKEIKVGETEVGNVTSDEIEIKTGYIGKIEANSWLEAKLYKQDEWFASLAIANRSKEDIYEFDCTIEEITIYSAAKKDQQSYQFEYDGVNLIGAKEEELLPILQEFDREEGNGKVTFYRYEDSYSFRIELENDIVNKIELKHEFDKSYEAK